ncbi:gamma-crystallin S-1-like [Lampris incognitus]|uniref:gamma-crystallin S-1-like n=1 Tax=Lampris incognitus TaxID=2546036 RepID=UPI0024B55C86|nr:gamma-crystallin S-1-like [Lampris incognitus]
MEKSQIIFYEDRNFQGRCYECSNDSSDLHSYFSHCNSIRVENGFWVLYERPNYQGYQYVLSLGEYPDYQHWLGFSDSIKSCRIIRNVGTSWRLKIWEKPSFEGHSMEVADNMPALHERWHSREVHSCKVFEGACVFYEHPNYRGRQYLLERGEYRKFTEWGGLQANIGSIRLVKEI